MKLVRMSDRHSMVSNTIFASKSHANLSFNGFGKGRERGSFLKVILDMTDVVSIISEMARNGSEPAQWLEIVMQQRPDLASIVNDIYLKRAAEDQEEEEYQRKRRDEIERENQEENGN